MHGLLWIFLRYIAKLFSEVKCTCQYGNEHAYRRTGHGAWGGGGGGCSPHRIVQIVIFGQKKSGDIQEKTT